MDDNLCDLCREINLYTLGAFVHDQYDPKRPMIKRTADQLSHDCPLCRLFLNPDGSPDRPAQNVTRVRIEASMLERLPEDQDEGTFYSEFIAWLRRWKPKSRGIEYYPLSKLSVSIGGVLGSNISLPCTLDVLAEEDNDEIKRYVGGRIVRSTDSDIGLHQVGHWLSQCLDGHSRCKVGVSGRKFNDNPAKAALPDRLIHVGGPAVEPHLFQTAGKRGRYSALSYCWEPMEDGEAPFRLLSSNLASLQEQLPMAKLPGSIRDAIDFTRRLGISYIWIDRLCIIQDDDNDWKNHATEMCNIYEGAVLTIAAVAAKTRDEGLYFTPPERPGVRIKATTHEKEVGYMRIARRSSISAAIETELGMSKWNTRGWVMQEQKMSRRIVYFGRTQILWECQQMSRQQNGIADTVTDIRNKSSLYTEFWVEGWRKRLRAILPFVVAKTVDLDFWYPFLEDYTSRDLTYPDKDKEKAMAGVAAAARMRLGMSKYAYGIFLERVDQMLLWYAKSTLKATEAARAPSWSWMAFDGQIRSLKPKSKSWTRGFGHCAFLDRETAQLPSDDRLNAEISHLPASVLKISGARVIRMKCRVETPDNTQYVHQWLENAFLAFTGEAVSDGTESDSDGSESDSDGSLHLPDPRKVMYLPKLIEKAFESQNIAGQTAGCHLMLCFGPTDSACGIVKFDTDNHDQQLLVGKEISCLIVGEETTNQYSWRRWKNDETKQKKTYHLLVMTGVGPSASPRGMGSEAPAMYRRVGVAQSIWWGELGCPLHKEAMVGEIFIV